MLRKEHTSTRFHRGILMEFISLLQPFEVIMRCDIEITLCNKDGKMFEMIDIGWQEAY